MKQSDHKDEAKTETPSPPKSQTNTPEEVATEDPLLNAVQLFEKEQSMIEDWVDTEVYFGSVRSVAEGSVAESCGIEDCDRLIAFGAELPKSDISKILTFLTDTYFLTDRR